MTNLVKLLQGTTSKDFYESYIQSHVSKKGQKKFESALEIEDCLEYYRIDLKDKNDSQLEYSTLWFFDIGLSKGYYPVYITNINTSSYMALSMCGMDMDEDSEEEIDRIVEDFPPCETSAKQIKEILNKQRILS